MKKITALLFCIISIFCICSGCIREDLQYELHSSGEYYIVTGKADVAKKNITIAKEYKGLPVREIESEAFINWIKLDSITIPKSVMRIGERAFSGCKNLQNLQIEEGVEEIGEQAIGKGFLEIGEYAFSDCDSLTKVILPKSVQWIERGAFYDCDSLVEVIIPRNVEKIGTDAFSECDSLMSIVVDVINQYFQSIDGVLYNKNETVVIKYPQSRGQESYSIGYDVREIKEKAFFKADFKVVDLGNMSLEKIGDYAFQDCKKIEEVTIGERVNKIGKGCFFGCVNLQRVTFNDMDNWSVVKKNEKNEVTDHKDISFEDLSDPDIAIDLLQKYSEYEWFKS